MKKCILISLILSLLFLLSASAQKKIMGKVSNTNGEPIEGAMLILKIENGQVLGFSTSKEKGLFRLDLSKETQQATLTASIIGYKSKSINIDISKQQYFELILTEGEIDLKTVEIKKKPVLVLRGDTLDFNPSEFSHPQDRTIGDILKKLPGIKIGENGEIKYNGKSISNFYIDGDNILNDRYNLGAKIPYGYVEKVQVIEKDQPIKLLRKNNMSENVALNLVIKDEAKLKMIKELGLGLGVPEKLDGNYTMMSLGKKMKFIYNLTANNIGTDPALEITAHNADSYNNEFDRTTSFLSMGTVGNPPLPQSRYLTNRSGLMNLNNFYKITKDLNTRVNFSYLYHQEDQNIDTFSETYLNGGETIRYNEVQQNKIRLQKLYADINITGNTETNFISNTLRFAYEPKVSNSNGVLNSNQAFQLLKQNTLDLFNEFSYRKRLKSTRIINLYSYFNINSKPEILKISPGINDSLFNAGNPYAFLNQKVNIPTSITNNYASFSILHGSFMQHYKAGFNIQKQKLVSDLYKSQYDSKEELIKNLANNLSWLKTKFYSEASYEYSGLRLRTTLKLPVGYNIISYNDPLNKLDQKINKIFIDPSININYKVGLENYAAASYGFSNKLGGMDEIFKGTILKNYRSLFSNDAPVSEQKRQHADIEFKFKNSLEMLFLGIMANYENTNFNTISSYILKNNLLQKISVPVQNHKTSWSFNVNGSKYLFRTRSTINGAVSYNVNDFGQLQNGSFVPFKTSTISYSGGIECKLNSFLSGSYQGNYSITKTFGGDNDHPRVNPQQLNQRSSLTATAFKHFFISFSAEHNFVHQRGQQDLSYLFSDLNLRYTFVKLKTNLQFVATNLANVKKFETIDFSSNGIGLSSYQIPGRMLMIKSIFNF